LTWSTYANFNIFRPYSFFFSFKQAIARVWTYLIARESRCKSPAPNLESDLNKWKIISHTLRLIKFLIMTHQYQFKILMCQLVNWKRAKLTKLVKILFHFSSPLYQNDSLVRVSNRLCINDVIIMSHVKWRQEISKFQKIDKNGETLNL